MWHNGCRNDNHNLCLRRTKFPGQFISSGNERGNIFFLSNVHNMNGVQKMSLDLHMLPLTYEKQQS